MLTAAWATGDHVKETMKTSNRSPASRLAGVLPIVHVPFDGQDRIDEADLKREVDWIFSVGADGLGPGIVSEVLRLPQCSGRRPRAAGRCS